VRLLPLVERRLFAPGVRMVAAEVFRESCYSHLSALRLVASCPAFEARAERCGVAVVEAARDYFVAADGPDVAAAVLVTFALLNEEPLAVRADRDRGLVVQQFDQFEEKPEWR
jgi:hypothetical protein